MEMYQKLLHEMRDAKLQQRKTAPLQNFFFLNEQRLLGDLRYTSAHLTLLPVYVVVLATSTQPKRQLQVVVMKSTTIGQNGFAVAPYL